MEHLLVGDEQKRKTESKMRKRMALGLQTRQSRGYGFWKGGKEVFECKNVPPFVILIIWCRGGSPRRANLHFFFFFFLRGTLTMSPPFSWISILPNLNLLRLELGVDYLFFYFLKQTNSKRKLQNTKDTGLPCSDILCLFRTEKGQRSVGRDPIPTCVRP